METYTLGAPRHAHGEQALWVFHDQAFALSDQIVLASAITVVSANAIMEDGSRFHALELRCPSRTLAVLIPAHPRIIPAHLRSSHLIPPHCCCW